MKLPDKVLTFVRDHPLMENSVTAAPLLVRKGIRYTKLAVTLMGRVEAWRGAVLHLGTGEERRSWRVIDRSGLSTVAERDTVWMCVYFVADRGELHRVAVVGQNATLLQEIHLFTPEEPVNNILLHQVDHMHPHSTCSIHSTAEVANIFLYFYTAFKKSSLCFQGQALVGSSLSLARIKAEGCALYDSCEVCARARGLGCVWNTTYEACRPTQEE